MTAGYDRFQAMLHPKAACVEAFIADPSRPVPSPLRPPAISSCVGVIRAPAPAASAAECVQGWPEKAIGVQRPRPSRRAWPGGPGPRRPIVVALARAFKWQKMLDTGDVGSMEELAERQGVDRSYVGRTLKLAALAPSIVETILGGQEPSSLSLMELYRPLPVRWDEQPRMLAF